MMILLPETGSNSCGRTTAIIISLISREALLSLLIKQLMRVQPGTPALLSSPPPLGKIIIKFKRCWGQPVAGRPVKQAKMATAAKDGDARSFRVGTT